MPPVCKRCLIVMTRLPVAGVTKTRLIPALGAAGASSFHDRLAKHAIGRASSLTLLDRDIKLIIQLAGGSPARGHEWLGGGDIRPQSNGDLGERMKAAVTEAFDEGASEVVVIGTDCPSVDETLLGSAYEALMASDLVFGPAEDGGFYLVGMKQLCPEVFENVPWGESTVLEASLRQAERVGRKVALLDQRRDVDTPDDLPPAEKELERGTTISVVIPTLNEASVIADLVERLRSEGVHEVLVCDGGSTDATVQLAQKAGARVIPCQLGRAVQMNQGAKAASGEMLLFLHADTLPPEGFRSTVVRLLTMPGTSAGAFRFKLDGRFATGPVIEALVALRCRLFKLPYGDQGLFIRKRFFLHLVGFPEWPAMEDLHFVRRLKKAGTLRMADCPATTSSRRWREKGLVRTTLLHQAMLAAYYLGLSPSRFPKLFRRS